MPVLCEFSAGEHASHIDHLSAEHLPKPSMFTLVEQMKVEIAQRDFWLSRA